MADQSLIDRLTSGDFKAVARCLTMVENELGDYIEILKKLPNKYPPVLGITGPPGAGKSTLINSLVSELARDNKRVAILAVDPTSAFSKGSLLGDRIRMNKQFNNPGVYIRSVATRGYLGGISEKTFEMADVLKAANFDYVIIETAGVGQSEIEIAALADITVLVLVPEAGDDIQNIKSGIIEIADLFVVNKADRPDASLFANNLKKEVLKPVYLTEAISGKGVVELINEITHHKPGENDKKLLLLENRIFNIIGNLAVKSLDKKKLRQELAEAFFSKEFNVYKFSERWIRSS
ncbi:methylmalonyl Co-A mutase-associated GTPase MeaB [Pedobacter sp. HMF7647]|uniref:Methylmalonyl Co-A mutase-associated GTPase MeaB n=1 Tax=Hufsiella arboris TaxID=2695275 RepID=A0A7K1Y7B3_9SPHI|nr:methylmalonyl Co-A mutase-associated GTPase MeaB [Hufsiella arboris]MXV50019.1 methylmalonyl Co-A mutase-associated GTPase MeaB [Hufsiella arboris]